MMDGAVGFTVHAVAVRYLKSFHRTRIESCGKRIEGRVGQYRDLSPSSPLESALLTVVPQSLLFALTQQILLPCPLR